MLQNVKTYHIINKRHILLISKLSRVARKLYNTKLMIIDRNGDCQNNNGYKKNLYQFKQT